MQRGSEQVIRVAELLQRAGDEFLRLAANPGGTNGQAIGPIDTLTLLLLDFEHLLRASANRHVARRLIDLPPSSHVLQALLFDLDVQQHQRVQANVPVLLDPVVEARGPPALGEEDHADRLAKIVQLQPGRANARQDGRVRDRPNGDAEFARAEDQVRVRRCAEGVPDDQEGHIHIVGVAQDLVAVGLDHLAVGNYNRAPIVRLLLRISVSPYLGVEREEWARATYQDRLVYEKDTGVGLQVHPRCLLGDLEPFDGNVRLVGEAETY